MRPFLLATVGSPLALALLCAAPAAAQTTVSANTSTPVSTATANNGSPADVTIATGVTVTPASGTAVTVNSNNSVTNNGTITFSGIDNATGIAASGGLSGNITNAGTITVSEPVTATDTDNDGDLDGPLANGTGRTGIAITGTGAFTGAVSNTGTITVIGNNSAGIAIAPQLTGTLTSSGTVGVTGTNGFGLHTGAVTGDVTLTGSISATGQNAIGVALDGNVGGTVSLGGSVLATGFRGGSTVYAAPDADDLLIGGPAVRIGGNVANGISVISTGTVTSYGSAPALQIGSTTGATTIGPVAGGTAGLVIAGTVTGSGVNAATSGTAIAIGVGQPVTINGSITVSGTVTATGVGAPATALALASGVSTTALTNSGTITATGGNGAFNPVAVSIASGANLPSIANSGVISAVSIGSTGTATAIQDRSGTLASINNSGTIGVSLASGATANQAVAIDLTTNTGGVTIVNSGTGSPAIRGAVLTGSGNDQIQVPIGSILGALSLGAGNNAVAISGTGAVGGDIDFGAGTGTLTVSGTGKLAGNLTFGPGSSMTLSDTAAFAGTIVQNGNPLALTVNGGAFGATSTGAIALSSLSVGATGALQVNANPSTGAVTLYQVSGNATLASGASLRLVLSSFQPGAQSYTVLTAGSLSAGQITVLPSSLPFLYSATANTSGNAITLSVAPKSAAELGLNRSATALYPTLLHEAQVDTTLGTAVLATTTAGEFQRLSNQLLPDHAGALFLSASDVSRQAAELAGDPATPRAHGGGIGLWAGELAGLMTKGVGDTQSYNRSFVGLAGGAEVQLGSLGAVGGEVDWSYQDDFDRLSDNRVSANLTELGGYWRESIAGLRLFARGAYGFFSAGSTRSLTDPTGQATSALYTATSDWSGHTTAINGSAAYEAKVGRFVLRPNGGADYLRLTEDAHGETGGGAGFNLAIAARTSEAWSAHYGLAIGYRLGSGDTNRLEVEVGNRQRLSGGAGSTTATYADGQSFTLTPDALRYGPEGKLRLAVGNDTVSGVGQVSVQRTEGEIAAGITAGIRVRL